MAIVFATECPDVKNLKRKFVDNIVINQTSKFKPLVWGFSQGKLSVGVMGLFLIWSYATLDVPTAHIPLRLSEFVVLECLKGNKYSVDTRV